MRIAARLTILAAALVLPLAAQAGVYWTSIASACVVDPQSPYYEFVESGLTYLELSSSTSPIQARCNVVTTQDTNAPGWTTLEIGYSNATSNGQITAEIVQVTTGNSITSFCTVSNNSNNGTHTCTFTNAFDFSTYAYYVDIVIGRAATGEYPQINYVSLH
jgi:hypothetical protein